MSEISNFMKANFIYIHPALKIKEMYDIRLKTFQKEKIIPVQMSLLRANHLTHNTYFC